MQIKIVSCLLLLSGSTGLLYCGGGVEMEENSNPDPAFTEPSKQDADDLNEICAATINTIALKLLCDAKIPGPFTGSINYEYMRSMKGESISEKLSDSALNPDQKK